MRDSFNERFEKRQKQMDGHFAFVQIVAVVWGLFVMGVVCALLYGGYRIAQTQGWL